MKNAKSAEKELSPASMATQLGRKKHVSFRLSEVTIHQLDNLVVWAVSRWQLSPMSEQPSCWSIANRSTVLRQIVQDAYDAAIAQTTRGERMEHMKKKIARKRPR